MNEKSRNPYRQVTYTLQVTLPEPDNNYEFHRHVATVLQEALAVQLPTIKVNVVGAQCKNFHLWPPRPHHADVVPAHVTPRRT